MRISLVTATYNKGRQMNRGIRSLLRLKKVPNEIIIVDDGSKDNTKDFIDGLKVEGERQGVKIKYLYLDHPEPRISCKPRNYGFKRATHDFVIFSEPELLHTDETIERLLEIDWVKTGGCVVSMNHIYMMGKGIYKELGEEFYSDPEKILEHKSIKIYEDILLKRIKEPNSDWSITGKLDRPGGWFFGLTKELFESYGGFDESFEGYGYDDFDLFNRMDKTNTPVIKVNYPPLIHQWHSKKYPFNIYAKSDENRDKSMANISAGKFEANQGVEWGRG